MTIDKRLAALKKWLISKGLPATITLSPMDGDAGFRRYFRVKLATKSVIVVDSPKEYCNNLAFVHVGNALRRQGLLVPDIIHVDHQQGFFCLADFGNTLLSDVLLDANKPAEMMHAYGLAIELLPAIGQTQTHTYTLPVYDRSFINTELTIFSQWLLTEYLSITLSCDEQNQLNTCFDILIDNALEQPQVTMHRDFHSRNLMMLTDHNVGIIDYQDAVVGPITYDIVSLLRDCYMRWPDHHVDALFQLFLQKINADKVYSDVTIEQWQQWFDLMGLQRHLKASGIFARLLLRDNKPKYIKDIPLTLTYIQDIAAKYPKLCFLSTLIQQSVLPRLKEKQA